MDCDSVKCMIGFSTNTPFKVQRSTNLLAAQHVRTKIARAYVKFSVNKHDATILGHHIYRLSPPHCGVSVSSSCICIRYWLLRAVRG